MPLTGPAIAQQRAQERITIDPFDLARLEPNSYAVRLADTGMRYADAVLDAHHPPRTLPFTIPATGYLLEPGHLYLAHTVETIGSAYYAMTLDAQPAVSALGIWIQLSAPLGHIGAVIPWTLELAVAQPVLVFPRQVIGKVAFWPPVGALARYRGRYAGSLGVVASRLAEGGRA